MTTVVPAYVGGTADAYAVNPYAGYVAGGARYADDTGAGEYTGATAAGGGS